MTALAANRNTISKEPRFLPFPVAASTTIYKGSMVCLDANGYAVPAADTSGYSNVVGVAREKVDNSTGSAGDKTVVCELGVFKFAATSITQAMVGTTMYVEDDQTVDDVAGVSNNIRAGILVEYISSTAGWLLIDRPLPALGTVGTSDLDTGAVTAAKLSATLKKGFIPLDITTARIIATNAIQNTTEAGVPDGNTAGPKLERVNGATDKALRLVWAATEVNEIQFNPVPKPPDLDGASALTVHLLVDKDTNTDTSANIDVQVFDGIGDTECGAATAAITETTITEKSISVAAGDLGDHPGVLNIALVPSAHANDALRLYGAWIEYTRA